MTVHPDARGKIYRRVENGAEDFITVREALGIVNDAMMGGRSKVREMSSQKGRHRIKSKDGRDVLLIEIDASELPAEASSDHWSTASHRMLLHRFTEPTENGRALCNKRFRPWRYGNGYSFQTRAEREASEYARFYTFCPRCERKP